MTRFCYDLMQDRLLAKLQIHNPSNRRICFHTSSSAPFPCPITQKTISPIHEPPLEFPFQNSGLLQTSQESQAWDEPKAERSWGLCPVRGWIHFCPLILPPTELLGLSLGVGTGLVLPSAPERSTIRLCPTWCTPISPSSAFPQHETIAETHNYSSWPPAQPRKVSNSSWELPNLQLP